MATAEIKALLWSLLNKDWDALCSKCKYKGWELNCVLEEGKIGLTYPALECKSARIGVYTDTCFVKLYSVPYQDGLLYVIMNNYVGSCSGCLGKYDRETQDARFSEIKYTGKDKSDTNAIFHVFLEAIDRAYVTPSYDEALAEFNRVVVQAQNND